jgi:hypothetical protein
VDILDGILDHFFGVEKVREVKEVEKVKKVEKVKDG